MIQNTFLDFERAIPKGDGRLLLLSIEFKWRHEFVFSAQEIIDTCED